MTSKRLHFVFSIGLEMLKKIENLKKNLYHSTHAQTTTAPPRTDSIFILLFPLINQDPAISVTSRFIVFDADLISSFP